MTNTHADRRGSIRLADLFDSVLVDDPDLPALIEGSETTTFRQWWDEASLFASDLAASGVHKGTMVMLLLPSGSDFAIAYLAAMRLGAVVTAANPRLGPAEIAHIIERSAPGLIVTDTPERVAEYVACPIRTPLVIRDEAGTAAQVDDWTIVSHDEPAVVVWTSGSTGNPKGAWFDHLTLGHIADNIGPLSAPYDRKLFPVPFAHTAFMTRIYDQLLSRSTLVLTPGPWSAENMLEVLAAERITLGQGVTTQWEKLIALDALAETDLSHLRLVSTGASRVPAALVKAMRERLHCPVVVRYASTEVPLAFGTGIDDPIDTVASTVGRPLGGTEVEIRDEDGRPVPTGDTGRVTLRSPAQMRGYWRDRTAQTIAPDRWLTTSDLGRLDQAGNLTIVGRADDAYIRGGYNIYPSEVEAALASHPAVARVAVVGTPAPVIGEIGVAFVVLASASGAITEDELQAWCRSRIADYKTPDHVEFVEDLPVNATYKVDGLRLRTMAAELATEKGRLRSDRRS